MRRLLAYYLAVMKIAILEQIQYPFSNYIYLLGMIIEFIFMLELILFGPPCSDGADARMGAGVIGLVPNPLDCLLPNQCFSWESVSERFIHRLRYAGSVDCDWRTGGEDGLADGYPAVCCGGWVSVS